jgi:hypothetical protein
LNRESFMPGNLTSLDSLLFFLRRSLLRLNLNSFVTIFRQLIHFGPWRVVPKQLIRIFRPVVWNPHEDKDSLLGSLDVGAIAENLRKNSVAIAGVLPAEFVNRVRVVTDRLPPGEYKMFHQIDKDMQILVNDPSIKNVLRKFFKCAPVLLECSLVVQRPEQGFRPHQQHSFHVDYAAWESLNLFVYLTDVTSESSYHVVAKGSHRKVGFRDVLRGQLTDDEAMLRFGSSIQPILGPAGTLFF